MGECETGETGEDLVSGCRATALAPFPLVFFSVPAERTARGLEGGSELVVCCFGIF